jgi:hypothetical protein
LWTQSTDFPKTSQSGARLYETNLRALLVYFKHVNAARKSNDPDSCSKVLTYCNVIRQFHDVDEWATKILLSLCSPEGPNDHSMSHITPEQLKEQLNAPAASLPKSIEGSVAAKILGPVFDGSLIFSPKDTRTDKFNVQSDESMSRRPSSDLDHVFPRLNTPQAESARTGDFGCGSAIDLEKAPNDQSPVIPTIMLTEQDGTEVDANRPTKNMSRHTGPALDSSRLAPLAPVKRVSTRYQRSSIDGDSTARANRAAFNPFRLWGHCSSHGGSV